MVKSTLLCPVACESFVHFWVSTDVLVVEEFLHRSTPLTFNSATKIATLFFDCSLRLKCSIPQASTPLGTFGMNRKRRAQRGSGLSERVSENDHCFNSSSPIAVLALVLPLERKFRYSRTPYRSRALLVSTNRYQQNNVNYVRDVSVVPC